MRTFDFSPLYRAAIGFDDVSRMLESLSRQDDSAFAYPPYNVEKADEDHYRITMAVAGFAEDDLDIVVERNELIVKGQSQPDGEDKTYLHRGIAARAFERRFKLADHIKVTDANLVNGLLHIDLVREIPEEMKPRTVKIGANPGVTAKQVEDKTKKAA